MINQEMLKGLSLMTYRPEYSEVVILLNVSEMCQEDILQDLNEIQNLLNNSNINELCNKSIKLLEDLDDFTTHVSPRFYRGKIKCQLLLL